MNDAPTEGDLIRRETSKRLLNIGGMDLDTFPASPPRKKRRPALACEQCRRRKIKYHIYHLLSRTCNEADKVILRIDATASTHANNASRPTLAVACTSTTVEKCWRRRHLRPMTSSSPSLSRCPSGPPLPPPPPSLPLVTPSKIPTEVTLIHQVSLASSSQMKCSLFQHCRPLSGRWAGTSS